MSFHVSRLIFGLGRVFFTQNSQISNKVLLIARRWASNSSHPIGSPPSQTPSPRDPEWTAFVKNVQNYKNQPALFTPSDLKKTKELRHLEEKLSTLEKNVREIKKFS